MTLGEESVNKEEDTKSTNLDVYQSKYHNAMKIVENVYAKFLTNQIEFS